LRIAGAEACEYVVLKCLYGAFSCIDPVVVWLDEMYADVIGLKVCLDGFGGDIVDYIQRWFEASFGEVLYLCFEGVDGRVGLSVLHRGGEDGVGGPVV
jgi:hypothetical protein